MFSSLQTHRMSHDCTPLDSNESEPRLTSYGRAGWSRPRYTVGNTVDFPSYASLELPRCLDPVSYGTPHALFADCLGLLVGIVSVLGLGLLDHVDVALLSVLGGDALVDDLLPRTLLRLTL
jgi:hypothetical protein